MPSPADVTCNILVELSNVDFAEINGVADRYVPKEIQPEVLEHMEPVFERLSDEDLLERLQRGDTQNSNEALHSLIWRRCPKGVFASHEIIRFSTSLAVIQRNVGSIGLSYVLHSLGILETAVSERLLAKLDVKKENQLLRTRSVEYKRRRQVLRGKKRGEDVLWQKETSSYEAGGFGMIEEESGSSKGARKRRKKLSHQEGQSTSKRPHRAAASVSTPPSETCPAPASPRRPRNVRRPRGGDDSDWSPSGQ